MIELVFLACFGTGPATICSDKGILLSDTSVMGCMMSAQPQLAIWVEEHPGWVIQRWTCQPVGVERRT